MPNVTDHPLRARVRVHIGRHGVDASTVISGETIEALASPKFGLVRNYTSICIALYHDSSLKRSCMAKILDSLRRLSNIFVYGTC